MAERSYGPMAGGRPFSEQTYAGDYHQKYEKPSMGSGSPELNEKSDKQRPVHPSQHEAPMMDNLSTNRESFAPNPNHINILRFLLYGLTSLIAFGTAIPPILVVDYYNTHNPSIKPEWSSMIALIVFGFITPGILFTTFLITPRLFRYGTLPGLVNQVRYELMMLFSLCVIWVSGALAMANDLGGYENCIWDGYYHYQRPANFRHLCDLINITQIMAWVTFGVATLTWVVVTSIAIYIFLFLDQEVLSELTNDMGGRAWRAKQERVAAANSRRGSPTQQQYHNNPMMAPGMMRSPSSSARSPSLSSGHRRRFSGDHHEAESGGYLTHDHMHPVDDGYLDYTRTGRG